MEKEEFLLVIKQLIELGNFDRDDLHSISKSADDLIVERYIRKS
tara:strand:- start:271 stop:402 length:132 start_codon:yes stop_codon:yes gene_type:complete